MAIEFPANKFVGDTFPYQGMTYVWDGEKWTASGAAAFEDAYVKVEGDIMTGDLKAPNFISEGNVTATGDIIAANGIFEGDLQATSFNGGPLAGLRNAVINGGFDIWQRGESFSSGGFTADRWIASGTGGSTRSVTRYDAGDIQGIQYLFTSGGTASSRTMLQQKIEGVKTFAGETVTLSFEALSSNVSQISTDVQQFFGNGGSPSGTVNIAPKKHTGITNGWTKFSYSFDIPSINGKTIGTAGNDCLQVNFFLEAGSDFNARTESLGTQSGGVILRNVQLEVGPVATPFEPRPIGLELQLCQRYYQKHFILGKSICMHNSDGDSNTYTDLPLPAPMRTFEVTAGPDLNVGNAISTVGAGARLQDVQYANSACARLRMTKLGTAASTPNFISKIGAGQDYMYLDAEL